ncbi:hypothetical protein GVN20_08195 [Runella sp. CRIBMP]|uniref:protein BatD n=1 Tax=Runella sp. CRIBMP TaxID=2683261 RepID=UPI001412E507|nr:protein BatD [Runella sp. CRIBMP]NBB19329.1 hypothetical protein [Runella sp. CRIBMP]
MIEQTYYPFGGDFDSFPAQSSTPMLSGFSSSIVQNEYEKGSGTNWFGWLLLIATLIGIAGVVYWWRGKISEL